MKMSMSQSSHLVLHTWCKLAADWMKHAKACSVQAVFNVDANHAGLSTWRLGHEVVPVPRLAKGGGSCPISLHVL